MYFDLEKIKNYQGLIGCDEVGRGPLAGPVVACAVRLDLKSIGLLKPLFQLKVTDSKKLSSKKRKILLEALNIDIHSLKTNSKHKKSLNGCVFEFVVSELAPKDIDRMNILQASLQAMRSASMLLWNKSDILLIDGNKEFEAGCSKEAVVKGDSKSLVIGLASIIAKEFRDEKMSMLAKEFPDYCWLNNAGYPTKEHRHAIEKFGVTIHHRKSFKGVKEFI